MLPTRRYVLSLSAAAAALATGACAGTTATQLASDVQLIASGLAAAVDALSQVPGVPAAPLARIKSYLATIQADAAKVAADTTAAGSDLVREIAAGVLSLAGVALPLIPGGSVAIPIVNAAVSLLPAILAAVGISGAGVTPLYTPDAARLILRAAR